MNIQTVFEKKVLEQSNHHKFNYEDVFSSLDITDSTRKDYLYRIPHFIEFIKSSGFNNDTYLGYKRHLSVMNNLSISTKNKHLTTAKIMLKELSRKGIIPDITSNVRLFSDTRKHKKTGITETEMQSIISHLRGVEVTSQNMRLKSLFALLIYQGLRISEIAAILLRDIDLVRNTLYIKGKGNDHKELIYLNPKTVEVIKNYIKIYRLSDGWLFPCLSNNGRGKHISTRTIQLLVKSVLKNLNIDKSCHSFRHYFVTRLIGEYKSDLTQVMAYSRHRSLSMLTVYNDAINQEKDLPRFFGAFGKVNL